MKLTDGDDTRVRDTICIGGLLAVVVLIFSPILFFGFIAANEDSLSNFYPLSFFFHEALRNGTSLLWNPYFYAGFPAFADISMGIYNPLHLFLFRFLPALDAHHLVIVFVTAAGTCCAYWFGRVNRLSAAASGLLALGYLTAGGFGGLAAGLFAPYGFLITPLLFLAISLFHEARSKKIRVGAFALGAGGMALAIMSGHPQYVLYGITYAGAYAVFLGWRRWSTVVGFIGMALLAGLLALPQLGPTKAVVEQSIRTGNFSKEFAVSYPITEIFSYFFPAFIHVPFFSGSLGVYSGALILIFAIVSIVFFLKKSKPRFFLISYLILAALTLRVPPFGQLYDLLPIFSRIRMGSRWLTVGSFGLAVIAAYGFDTLRHQGKEWFARPGFKRFVIGAWMVVGLLISFFVATTAALWVIAAHPLLQDRLFEFAARGRNLILPREHYRAVFAGILEQMNHNLSLANWRVSFLLLLYPAMLVLLMRFRRNPQARWFAPAILALVFSNLLVAFTAEYPNLLVHASTFIGEPAVVTTLKQRESNLDSFRILPLLTADGVYQNVARGALLPPAEAAIAARETLTGQMPGMHGVHNLYGQEPMRTLRQQLLIDSVIAPHQLVIFDAAAAGAGARLNSLLKPEIVRRVTVDEKIDDFKQRLALLAMLNVRYVATLFPIDDPRFTPVPLSRDPGLGVPLYLYELPPALPRFYFAANPEIWQGSERDLLLAVRAEENFFQKTFLECDSCRALPQHNADDTLEILSYRPGDVALRTRVAADRWLVFSESAMPGWIAAVDGNEAPIATANFLFQAILVPAGTHEISWKYHNVFLKKLYE